MNISSPGIARNDRKAPRCERHDAFLRREEQAEFAARFPAGRRAQMAFLLANYAGNVSMVGALLGTGVCTVRRHCRGWPPPPGLGLRRVLRRRVVDLVCPPGACPIVWWKRRARRIGKPGARPDGFRVIGAAWIADTRVPENLQPLQNAESFSASLIVKS
ncbi:hypothetical protein GA0115259_1006011 [Streptomyces sp. MnatMP-M17]|nr:hypothetical protein GA0115259_1006011 [Streptomyces sp. MnatMP-M17]